MKTNVGVYSLLIRYKIWGITPTFKRFVITVGSIVHRIVSNSVHPWVCNMLNSFGIPVLYTIISILMDTPLIVTFENL